jgi:hypothetical protein
LLLNTTYAQTIRRVNNNLGVTGVNVYATAQAAHDAAAANDIMIIEPSVTSYGDLYVDKPLKIYGNGYYLDTNTELKVDRRSSTMGYIIFSTGSDGSILSGVELIGRINNFGDDRGVSIYGVSNIKIERCRIQYTLSISNRNWENDFSTNVSNITINGNYLSQPGTIEAKKWLVSGFTISSVFVNNNILTGIDAGSSPEIQNWIVRNNVFTSSQAVLSNSIFENNIFTQSAGVTFSNTTFSYNFAPGNTFTGGVGNQNNYNVLAQLIGAGTGISDDEAYQIKAGSPLKTAGSGGTEVGAYGGPTPYVVSGIPAIPSIVNMNNTATGSNTVPLSVTISVKSNN